MVVSATLISLLARELWVTLLDERGRPFLVVVSREREPLRGGFVFECLFQRTVQAPVDQPLGVAERDCRSSGDVCNELRKG